MKSPRCLALVAISVLVGCAAAGRLEESPSQSEGKAMAPGEKSLPNDIYPDSRNRFPAIKREDLSEEGKKVFDAFVAEPGRTGLSGPMGIRMYNPTVAHHLHEANQFLRRLSDLPPGLAELAILVIARAWNSQYEWVAHEPAALREGISQKTIDVVKYRRDVKGLEEKEAVIIQLGRELFEQKKVTSETFARAVELFGRKGVVNITLLMGEYSSAAMILNLADQQLEPDWWPLLPIP